MTNLLENKINISYRRDDFASYMIIKVEDEETIINYQTEMITNNKIPKLLKVDIRRKNNEACFYYNITSKIPLSQFLNRKKVTKEELVAMLLQVTETMLASTNFLLHNKCFILQEKYIYINPATKEINLLYLPLSFDANVDMSLRNFVINLIVYSANIDDENTSDNYIQKILNYVKCETFNIADFNKLLVRMSGEEVEEVRQNNLVFESNLDEHEMVKEKTSLFTIVGIPQFIAAGISQLVILVLMLLSKDFFKSLSGNIKTTYFAIGLIIAAVDVIIFKNLFSKKKAMETGPGKGLENQGADGYKRGTEQSRDKITNHLDTIADMDTDNMDGYMDDHIGDYLDGNIGGHTDDSIGADIDSNTDGNMDDSIDSLDYEERTFSNHQYNTVLLAPSQEERAVLRCIRDGMVEEVLISNSDFLVGRLESYVDYIIKNKAVGKVHAQITIRKGKYYVKDLNSRNGTFINDIQIDSNIEHEIKNGDRITFANSDYEFKVC